MTYLRPQITYPLSCCILTQTQCRHIQAPALVAFFPKLHLNQHMPRAVLFAGPRYGGLSIPKLYTDQGYGQLKLLIGLLKLRDETGDLMLIQISHLQLHIRAPTPFFSLPFDQYAKWIDHTWLTSVWMHMSQLNIVIEVQDHWVPIFAWASDTMIMDLALTFNLNSKQLQQINRCRLYLQLLMISDLTTANGKQILPSIVTGYYRDKQRCSSLQWPAQQCPSIQDWTQWRFFLQHFSDGNKLIHPLDKWTARPLQKWQWFYHSIYQTQMSGRCFYLWFSPVLSERIKPVICTLTHSHATPPLLMHRLPTTIQYITDTEDAFTSTPSLSSFSSPTHTSTPTLWPQDAAPAAFVNTPLFYQRLIGPAPPTLEACECLRIELQKAILLACSDGAYEAAIGKGSHGWVFASEMVQDITAGAGPADGHALLMSSYHTE